MEGAKTVLHNSFPIAESALYLRVAESQWPGIGVCTHAPESPDESCKDLEMKKWLYQAVCFSLASASGLNLARAQGGSSLANVSAADSIAELRTYVASGSNADVVMRGYYTAGDGGGGHFYWDAVSTDRDDRGTTIIPASNPACGRWKRSYQGEVNAKWFGAVGDGVTADSAAIQAALDYVDRQGGGKVFLPKGTYLLESDTDSTLKLGNNSLLEGSGTSSVILSTAAQAIRNRNVNPTSSGGYGNSDITIQNLAIECAGKGINGIFFASVTEGTIHNVKITNPVGYGIWLFRLGDTAQSEGKPTRRVTVSNCHITGIVDVGIECSGAVGCTIVGNTVTGSKGIAGYYAWNGATDCVFTGNVAEGEGELNNFVGFEVQPSDFDTCPVPAANKTQTQRITFNGNVARNVWVGTMVKGTPTNRPCDVHFEGNSLAGISDWCHGVVVAECSSVRIIGNQIVNFGMPLALSEVGAGWKFNSAVRISIDNNTIRGGGTSYLYGNVGGSLSGNIFIDVASHAVRLLGWNSCSIDRNRFMNCGTSGYTYGIVAQSYGGTNVVGNSFQANRTLDDRTSKCMYSPVLFLDGNPNLNVVTGNSAVGVKPGAPGFLDITSSTNNIVANNIGS